VDEEAPPQKVAPLDKPMEEIGKQLRAGLRQMPWQLGSWPQEVMAELAMLATLQPARAIMGFIAYDCFNSFNRVEASSLMELSAYPPTETPRGGEDHVWQDCPDEEGPNCAFVPLYCMVI
jgi:hypothetical protein